MIHYILVCAVFVALTFLVVNLLNPKKYKRKSSTEPGFPSYIISDLSATGFPEAPLGAKAMFLTVIGSGGGGCGGITGSTGATSFGGGGAAVLNSVFLPLPAANYNVQIGAGGLGGAAGGGTGANGAFTRVIDVASGVVIVELAGGSGGSTVGAGVGGTALLGVYNYSFGGSNGSLTFGGGAGSSTVGGTPVQQGILGGGNGGALGTDGQLFGGGGAPGVDFSNEGGDGAHGGIIVNYI